VRELARKLAAQCAAKAECDFVEDFAKPFPVGIFLDLMGLPADNMSRFLEWEALIMRDKQTRSAAMQQVSVYLQELITERRRNPADDLITFAVQAKVDNRPLTDSELVGVCVLLFIRGPRHRHQQFRLPLPPPGGEPRDQDSLRQNPGLIPSAVEELFRAYAVVNTNRYATRDVEFAGVQIKKGDNVTCSTILASRDPREFENPNQVIFTRSPNPHNAFSFGPHRCLGSHLARREIIVGIEEWLRVIPPFRVKPGAVIAAHGAAYSASSHCPSPGSAPKRICRRDGVRLAADVYGEAGRPSIVCLPGAGQTRHAWRRTALRLASLGYYVVSVDLRGHGGSSWACDGDYSIEAFAADVRAMIRALPAHQFCSAPRSAGSHPRLP